MEQPTKTPEAETLQSTQDKITPAPLPELHKEPHTPWRRLKNRAGTKAVIIGSIIFVLLVGSCLAGLYYFVTKKAEDKKIAPTSAGLNDKDLKEGLSSQGQIGRADQTLSIGAKTLFGADVQGEGSLFLKRDLSVAGKTTLQDLEATKFTANDLMVKGKLDVAGPVSLGGTLAVATQLSAATLSISGNSSFGGTLTGGNLSVKATTVAGNLTVTGHLVTGGATPGVSGGGGLGGGGTVSITGNDTAGRVNCNAGAAGAAGTLCTVSFRVAYGAAPTVVLTPTTSGSAKLKYYVAASTNGFSIVAVEHAPVSDRSYGFSYLVMQ